MAYSERQKLLAEIERVRGSRILAYVLSDRETFPPSIPGFTANLATEPQLLFVDQLRKIGRVPRLDLFLYTRGGTTDSVWPLVSILREHCDSLAVLVPFRAHSGGTLICLGANEVIMTPAGELSPIDPTTGNQFNPTDPANPQQRFGISVEDVTSYFALSDERAGITQEDKLDVFKELTSKVHPLALGNVERVYRQIRRLAKSLLALHLDPATHESKIEEIVRALTEQFYSHVHSINRQEASSLLGKWVRSASKDEEQLIWSLFESYVETLGLRSKFSLPEFMEDNPSRALVINGAFVETTELSQVFQTVITVIQRPDLPSNVQVQVPPGGQIPLVPWAARAYTFSIQRTGWRINTDGA